MEFMANHEKGASVEVSVHDDAPSLAVVESKGETRKCIDYENLPSDFWTWFGDEDNVLSLEEELARAKSNTAFPMYVAKLTREVDESINWCEVFGTDDGLAEIEDFVEFMAATYRQKRGEDALVEVSEANEPIMESELAVKSDEPVKSLSDKWVLATPPEEPLKAALHPPYQVYGRVCDLAKNEKEVHFVHLVGRGTLSSEM